MQHLADRDVVSDRAVQAMQVLDKVMFTGSYYMDKNNELIPASKITTNYLQGGRNVTSVITPNVVAAARSQLGCGQLRGAELEDDGGQGTMGSHWEQRLFEGARCCDWR